MSMKVAYIFNEPLKHYAAQLGVKYAVTGPNGHRFGKYSNVWDYAVLRDKAQEVKDAGMEWAVLEGIGFIDGVKLGDKDVRDEQIAHFCTLLENLDRLNVRCVCYNWMPVWEWFRTSVNVPIAGGAVTSEFNWEDVKDMDDLGVRISADQLWCNLEYFLKKVVPVAERCKVKLAIHPDDPPIKSLGGVDRILTSADAMYEVTQIVQSEYNGITLCQGNFAAMGEDIPACIRRFAANHTLHFAHFRDIQGNLNHFQEAWHYDGITDMHECMKAYYEVGFDGVMRPDHVPTMYGDDNSHPGYAILGNLVATGYMYGLMESVEKELGLR